MESALRLRPGTATGIGSLPGEKIDEALRVVLDELPDFPHLPELPATGAGAGTTGRTAVLLVDLHVDIGPDAFTLVERPAPSEARTRAMLRDHLDVMEELAGEYSGPFKIQVGGPWTLASTLELRRGGRPLGDHGACRDIAASLAEGVAEHVAEVRRRIPRASVVLQVDEPALPAVLEGSVPTLSGLTRFRPIEPLVAREALAGLIDAAGVPVVVHCCGAGPPVELARQAGAWGVSLDLTLVGPDEDEPLSEAVEGGLVLLAGALPVTDDEPPPVREVVDRVRELAKRLGIPRDRRAEAVVVTPACGLAGVSPASACELLTRAREAAAALRDLD